MRRPALLLLAGLVLAAPAPLQAADAVNAPPRPADWSALAGRPDFSGVWVPDITDQNAQIASNPAPWNDKAAKQIATLQAEERAGKPRGLFIDCLPEAMPSWMLISHNAFEFAVTPGRIYLLGESDGNRLRRIYTDGRGHPEDPDLTFHGHSIGRWEGDTLVVDTVGILPQAYLAISEAVGVPNNGDVHVVERIRLAAPDVLHDELEITAPHVLTRPWKTTRIYYRQRAHRFDIVEGVCLQGNYAEGKDANGDAVFVLHRQDEGGNVIAPAATAP